jgi:hypothetical protein
MKFLANLTTALHLSAFGFACGAQTLPQGLFSIGQFEIGKSTVDDVQSHFGVNKPVPIEPGEGADVALCYSTSGSPLAPTIVFETGALGGWSEVTAYRITRRGQRRCQLTNAALGTMSTGNGLNLNTARKLVVRVLRQSKPTVSGERIHVEEVYRRKPTESEAARMRLSGSDPEQIEFDVIETVEVRFKRGVLDELYVKRLVSF